MFFLTPTVNKNLTPVCVLKRNIGTTISESDSDSSDDNILLQNLQATSKEKGKKAKIKRVIWGEKSVGLRQKQF